jgi:hypothetical protein
MRRLIAITTLGLVLGFSSLSLASDHMSLYTKPAVKSEARNEAKGGNVEKDFTSFYTTPKTANANAPLKADRSAEDDEDYIIVFGVRIPVGFEA